MGLLIWYPIPYFNIDVQQPNLLDRSTAFYGTIVFNCVCKNKTNMD